MNLVATRLDELLLDRIAAKTGKSKKYVREQISKRATRLGISSEAAQILWARECGLGTGQYLRGLPSHMQVQVHDLLPSIFAKGASVSRPNSESLHSKNGKPSQRKDPIRAAIDYLLADEELRSRCSDLLRARANF